MATVLQEARRRRGWTQAQLQHEMRGAAARLGLTLPSGESLRVMLSSWENGRHVPSGEHVLVLCEAFGLPAEALGLEEAPEPVAEAAPVRSLLRRRAADAGPEVADYYVAQMAAHARMGLFRIWSAAEGVTGPGAGVVSLR